MKKQQAILIIAILLMASIASPKFTMDEWERLKAGEVVITEVANQNDDGSQRIDFLAKIYIKADRKAVWAVLRDYEKFPEFMPNLQEVAILKKEGEVYWVKYLIKVMVISATYCLRVDGVEMHRRIEFKLDPICPGDIRDTNGYWVLEDAPDRSGTVVSYSTYADTGIPAPEALARKAARKSLPQVAKNVRKRVESGGTWKKP